MEVLYITVGYEDEGVRVDKYLSLKLLEFSRSYVQKIIKDGGVSIDDKPVKANEKVAAGGRIAIAVPSDVVPDITPQSIPLDILYEDAHILIVNKPKGMVVHPSAGHYSDTLVNALMYHCEGDLSGINGVLRPGIVHRIDKDTTGALVVCKTDAAHKSLAAQLKEHSISRTYRTLVHGNIREEEGTIDKTIGRHSTDRKKMAANARNGKSAVTHYKVLERFGQYTYVECRLETGRTHQIRVHLSSNGHPVVGDDIYGPRKCSFPNLQGQTLHAMTLGFAHPQGGEYVEFEAPLPIYFLELLEKLR